MGNKKHNSHNPVRRYGRSYPLGASFYDGGVNFSLYSKNAGKVELLFFDDVDDHRPSRTITLDPTRNRTFHYWHTYVRGVQEGQLYGYRVHGPSDPAKGFRFDGKKLLLDPYARAIAAGKNYQREAAVKEGDNTGYAMKGVVVDPRAYNWEGDTPLSTPYSLSIIYEMHVAGFTRHQNSGISDSKRGTYAGLIEKIPYLKDLGITAIELLPVQQFDEQDVPAPLKNYWGYNPVGFFAPHCGYSSRKESLGAITEFRDMVKAFHKAGIEVILDVVFNHTAEGDEHGPTLSLRGLENEAYYILGKDKSCYEDYTGTGNSINANHSVVRRLIMDCLKYWVMQMHVDGFRFDLASVLSRGERGEPLENPPILWAIESAPELAHSKIIAEAWDAAGLYQVGSFIGDRWTEWNGRFRDDIRRFVKGDEGMVRNLGNRIMGSPDIYTNLERDFNRSINFITCHDGFTLNDLVSYNEKHNDDNRENNRDGNSENFSWNCGVEGPAENRQVDDLRNRQIKNFITLLFISQGTPMLMMGDEIRRTQQGNNNAYCQDNEISWFNWDLVGENKALLEFVKGIISFTQDRPIFSYEGSLNHNSSSGKPHIIWHGIKLRQPDWSHHSHTLASTLIHPGADEQIHLMINAYWKELEFEIPSPDKKKQWKRIIDTSLTPPDDFRSIGESEPVSEKVFMVAPRSVVLLFAVAKKN